MTRRLFGSIGAAGFLLLGFLVASQPASAQPAEAEPVAVPIRLQRGRILVPATINDSNPLSFLLDTGCGLTTLHPDLVDELKLQPSGRIRITGIAGEERAPMYRGAVFDLGQTTYEPSRVAAIPSERSESRRRRDGVLGSGFFRRFVVEIDPQSRVMRLHSPTNYTYSGSGEVIPIRFEADTPIIQGAILAGGTNLTNLLEGDFEIDSGCDSGLCLGAPFIKQHKLLESSTTESSEKFGVGGSVQTRSGAVPVLRLGKLEIRKPQTYFFIDSSPVDEPIAGHIGMGILRQFKVIFDYSRKRMILEAL